MSMIDADGIAPGAVAQTFQKGYLLNDRLLRPAMVVVARQD
jgi:molecular chaperone GrpE